MFKYQYLLWPAHLDLLVACDQAPVRPIVAVHTGGSTAFVLLFTTLWDLKPVISSSLQEARRCSFLFLQCSTVIRGPVTSVTANNIVGGQERRCESD